MTGEELERTIEFIIDQQAKSFAGIESLKEGHQELRQEIQALKEISQIHAASIEQLAAITLNLNERQNKADEDARRTREVLLKTVESLRESQSKTFEAIHESQGKAFEAIRENQKRNDEVMREHRLKHDEAMRENQLRHDEAMREHQLKHDEVMHEHQLKHDEAIRNIHEAIRESQNRTDAQIAQLTQKMDAQGERFESFVKVVERYITGNGKA